jgi:hypothetical protein
MEATFVHLLPPERIVKAHPAWEFHSATSVRSRTLGKQQQQLLRTVLVRNVLFVPNSVDALIEDIGACDRISALTNR